MQKINVAIIGFGLSGRAFHAPIIHSMDKFNLKKIYTKNQSSKELINDLYNSVEVVEDTSLIFEDETIDLVVIATPNTLHFELAKESLISGKHVIVEKPFTVTSKEADHLIEIAKREERVISVYQNRRFDSDFKTIQKILDKGWLGNLVEYEAHFDRFRNYFKDAWKEKDLPGSGIVYDLGSHLIDQALCLFGLPNEIYGDIRNQRKGARVEDNFEIILYYNELKVTLKAGMLVKEDLPRYILLGDKGSFIKSGMDVQEGHLREGKLPFKEVNWGIEEERKWGIINSTIDGINVRGKVESEKGDYREYYNNIYDAIVNDKPLLVTAEDGRNIIKVIELAMESNIKRRRVKF
ncbi:Gfo/Idh/MocA family oxidoreductase [Clostridium sp. D2Q-11]|uniref:Gfo/Idh/MocA family oxidoreductase n=1 Tax=Anaeromonas frigoriresistens TaxID=2683708 RepID=A0A942UT28_9FIRM|nr:Gfo/Idh/MocA family oxidoreductase [Anaeromonas frigoriresistens]MBS4538623.1 Gfo/Idh/MocA family oxidoreductase [Anaeromonas frigoriresistens]